MNTETMILAKDLDFDINKLKVPDLKLEEEKSLEKYISITKQIQELDQLFHIFRYNLKMLLNHYKIYHDGTIEYHYLYDTDESDYIVINTLVINYIGSGRTLTEAIEKVIEDIFGKNTNLFKELKENYISKEYDTNLSYRLLHCMRNFSQHGYLPVSTNDDGMCVFDIDAILSASHFNFKKKIKEEMLDIKQRIYEKYKDYPRINFTKTIADFNIGIIKVYKDILNIIDSELTSSVKEIKKLIRRKPKLIHKSSNHLNNFILYRLSDGSLHCFSKYINKSIEMINGMKDNVSNILQEENIEYEKIMNTCMQSVIKEEGS